MLKCRHKYNHDRRETLVYCRKCPNLGNEVLMPVIEANPHEYWDNLRSFDGVYNSCYSWDVKLSCGHGDCVYTLYNGSWCNQCKKWSMYDSTKEKKMIWNGKKYWEVVNADTYDSCACVPFSTLEEAEAEAKRLTALNKRIYLVLETVSGFMPPEEKVEPVKFKK